MKEIMSKSNHNPIETVDKKGAATRPSLRVAAYFQYDGDDHITFDSLYNHYHDMIANNIDWTLVGIFSDSRDDAASKRLYFNRQILLTKCRKGKVDKIIVRSMGQFERNLRKCQEIIQELIALEVDVYFEKENVSTPEAEVVCNFIAELARRECEFFTQNSAHMKYMPYNYTKSKNPRRKKVNPGFTIGKAKE